MKIFGELTRQEQLALFEAWLDGKQIEFYDESEVEWFHDDHPNFFKKVIYRIKPTKPSINWDHVHPDYKWLAMDEGGEAYVYTASPTISTRERMWDACGSICKVKALVSFKEGTCDWQDSLVMRPEK